MFETIAPIRLVPTRIGRMLRLATAVLVIAAVLASPAVANAGSERMTLDCGDEIGMIERTNGASWWSEGDGHGGVTYVTRSLTVSANNDVVFKKDYGQKEGLETVTCTATHPGEDETNFTWIVNLAPVG